MPSFGPSLYERLAEDFSRFVRNGPRHPDDVAQERRRVERVAARATPSGAGGSGGSAEGEVRWRIPEGWNQVSVTVPRVPPPSAAEFLRLQEEVRRQIERTMGIAFSGGNGGAGGAGGEGGGGVIYDDYGGAGRCQCIACRSIACRVERSMALLRRWLSREQRDELNRKGVFHAIGSMSKRRYRIYAGWSYNVVRDDGVALCFAPSDVPIGDVMLAQKLALETDEMSVYAVANLQPPVTSGRRPALDNLFSLPS